MKVRIETDSIGKVEIKSDNYWGAQTQRSMENFRIGSEKVPMEVVKAITMIKLAAARVNTASGKLEKNHLPIIEEVCSEIISGQFDSQFGLSVWQTGSGTQTNMNVNEVIANRAIEKLGGVIGSKTPIHPNDHINMSQSSNDTFPTAMRIATIKMLYENLLPALGRLKNAFLEKVSEFEGIIKVGRTHMQDATPIALSQEFSCFAAQLKRSEENINAAAQNILEIPQGGTAVGTGINTEVGFDRKVVSEIAKISGFAFTPAENKFSMIASHDDLVAISGCLNTLAASLMKIGNDIRLLASGPRCGINEIILPAKEPGSSIMPGKVNPTQCESLTMVCSQIMGNHLTITVAGSSGHLQLNTFKPVIIYNLVQSIRLLSDTMANFAEKCVIGMQANRKHIKETLGNSLMLATALNQYIGYDNAAKIVKLAHQENMSLAEAARQLELMSEDEIEKALDPSQMISPKTEK